MLFYFSVNLVNYLLIASKKSIFFRFILGMNFNACDAKLSYSDSREIFIRLTPNATPYSALFSLRL